MSRQVRHLRQGQAEFQKEFSRLCYGRSAWQAWSDFVELSAIAIANTTELRRNIKRNRDERYLTIIERYNKEEQLLLGRLFGILVKALDEEPEQDFLGEMFMSLELGSHWHGQFFTPYNITKMMADLQMADALERLKEQEWITVNDPACGAGATLIGVRNRLNKQGIGGTQAFFVGQDIDRTAGMMCYIQLSLLGCAGYVVIANTLTNPVTGPTLWPHLHEGQETWFMPLLFTDPVWAYRLSKEWNDSVKKRSCREKVTTEVQPTSEETTVEVGQLTLF